MRRLLQTLALLLVTAAPVAASETIEAVWKHQTVEFSYVSLHTAYSCELMKARITMLLGHVGAADGVEVTIVPCSGFDRPQTRYRIAVTFSSLARAAEGAVDVVKAAWSEVELGDRNPPSIRGGDCELLEEFQEHLLPTIEHEVIEGATGCGATRRSIVGRLRLKVLKPAGEPARAEDSRSWGQRLADSTIAEHPSAWNMRESDGEYRWAYTQGLVTLGMYRLSLKYHEPRYYDYMKSYVDHYVEADGSIRTLALDEFNIDSVNSGKLLFPLHDATGDPRYRAATEQLRRQLQWQPRTHNGVFWHKLKYPWQVWLDGLYMGAPFWAEYAARFGPESAFDDIAGQFTESYAKLRDPASGLLFHGWDESRIQRWSDPSSGCSPGFWTRSLGWYSMALVDAYEHFPAAHPGRHELARMLAELSEALLAVRDERTKLWWQVPDQGGREGNYLEASGSAMIAYAWAKGVRLGMVEARYRELARQSFVGLVEELVDWDAATDRMRLRNVCRSAGLGGDPYRDGTYAYYVSTDVVVNDAHGVGAFLLASAEIE